MTSSVVFHQNPYVIGVPIDDPRSLFGREPLINFVRDNLTQGARTILLSGQRRMGKSSVLRHIPKQIHVHGLRFVPFDLQGSTGVPLTVLLARIAEAIARALELPINVAPTTQEMAPEQFAGQFLPSALRFLKGGKLVLLFDEFDAMSDESDKAASQGFFQYLSGVLDRESSLCMIAVIGRRLDQLPSLLTMFKGAPHQEIGLLSEDSAGQQITSPAEGTLSYSKEAIAAVFALSSGHPYFTQLICHVLFQRARERKRWTVDATDVESVVDDAINAGEGGLMWFRDGLPVAERTVFSATAEMGDPASRARAVKFLESAPSSLRNRSLPEALLASYGVLLEGPLLSAEARLIEWGFLREAKGTAPDRSRSVTVELVRRWMVHRFPVRWEIFELERLVPEAGALYQEGQKVHSDGDFTRAIALWERAIELNPNHLHAVTELAEALLEDGRFDRAVTLFERAYRADPQGHKEGYLQALNGYARDLLREYRYAPARTTLLTALEITPDNRRLKQRLEEAEKGIRQEVATRNPFFVGSGIPAEQFIGRQAAISEIISASAHGGHVALFGQTGLGKTSLLQYLGAPGTLERYGLGSGKLVTVNVDCQIFSPMSPQRFWQHIQTELARALKIDSGSLGSVKRWLGRGTDLSAIYRMASESGRSILILLDEFEKVLEPTDTYGLPDIAQFQQDLRNLAGTRQVSLVLSTHRRLVDVSSDALSPLYNIFKMLPLRMFDERELAELSARMPLELAPVSETELSWVRTASGGYPCLVESAFSLLFRLRTAGQQFDPVSALQALSSETESFLTGLWQALNTAERTALVFTGLLNLPRRTPAAAKIELLQAITPGSIAPLFATFSAATRLSAITLMDTGLLRTTLDGMPEISGSLLEWWVVRKFFTISAGELSDMLLNTQLRALTAQFLSLSQDPQYRALPQQIALWAKPLPRFE